MKSVRTVAMYFPEASASRYEYTSNSTRLLITIHNFEFCRIPGSGNK